MQTQNGRFRCMRIARGGLVTLAALLVGCDSGSLPLTPSERLLTISPPSGVPATSSPPPWYREGLNPVQGYFEGYVTVGGMPLFADGLITADGLARIHISGSALDRYELRGSTQFIGQVAGDASRLDGSGTVVGEGCARGQSRFCTQNSDADISLTLTPDRPDGRVTGAINVAMTTGVETWPVEMRYPLWYSSDCAEREPCYYNDASLAYAAGLYYVENAEFGRGLQTRMSVDDAGRLFFQDPTFGCIGNGALSPHLDGTTNVYDVTLIIESCKGEPEYLNDEHEGLATIHTLCPDEDCVWLAIYLSAAEETPPRKSVTFWWRR